VIRPPQRKPRFRLRSRVRSKKRCPEDVVRRHTHRRLACNTLYVQSQTGLLSLERRERGVATSAPSPRSRRSVDARRMFGLRACAQPSTALQSSRTCLRGQYEGASHDTSCAHTEWRERAEALSSPLRTASRSTFYFLLFASSFQARFGTCGVFHT
jgi:ribosomal protein L32